MKYFFLGFFILLVFTSFKPGEGKTIITGKSLSGKTLFTVVLGGRDILINAQLTIEGAKLNFIESDSEYILFRPKDKVFIMHLESDFVGTKHYKFVEFWAIPSSFQEIDEENEAYEFKGKLTATEPRSGKDFHTPEIELQCKLTYYHP